MLVLVGLSILKLRELTSQYLTTKYDNAHNTYVICNTVFVIFAIFILVNYKYGKTESPGDIH